MLKIVRQAPEDNFNFNTIDYWPHDIDKTAKFVSIRYEKVTFHINKFEFNANLVWYPLDICDAVKQ